MRRRQPMGFALWPVAAMAQDFDHGHAAREALLKALLRWLPDGKQSRVDYAGFVHARAMPTTFLEDDGSLNDLAARAR